MNPAKAAPSAPVKNAAREDPQILPGGLLILFFSFICGGRGSSAPASIKWSSSRLYQPTMARKFLKKFPRRGHKNDVLARRTLQNAKKEA